MPAAAVTLGAIPAAKRRLLDEIIDSLRPTPNLAAIVLGGSHAGAELSVLTPISTSASFTGAPHLLRLATYGNCQEVLLEPESGHVTGFYQGAARLLKIHDWRAPSWTLSTPG